MLVACNYLFIVLDLNIFNYINKRIFSNNALTYLNVNCIKRKIIIIALFNITVL